MEFDIVIVTYNSKKWIDGCVGALAAARYDHSKLTIIFVDNASTDDTIAVLERAREKYAASFKDFCVVRSAKNLGFGRANNIGAQRGAAGHIFFLNADTRLLGDALAELARETAASGDETAAWELRQFPYEHPKLCDIATGETSWASGAALVVRREAFERAHGFDEKLFMYAEDVDLSWRLRRMGYTLKYVPKAGVYHFAYAHAGEFKPAQYYGCIINNLYLRYKFGGARDVLRAHRLLWGELLREGQVAGVRRRLFGEYLKHFFKLWPFVWWRITNRDCAARFSPKFISWDYETARDGAFYPCEPFSEGPRVSVVVRTHKRPDVLRQALRSLERQTYKNVEIIVVEDGEPTAREVIYGEFAHLGIIYEATVQRFGRSRCANIGMALATGKYINFLDDDDFLFAEHIETLVCALGKQPHRRVAYALSLEAAVSAGGEVLSYKTRYRESFNRLLLFIENYLPIQCVMFEKELVSENGGFDEGMDALEDWDFWVRLARDNDFLFVEKATSVYRVPGEKAPRELRQKNFAHAWEASQARQARYSLQNVPVNELANELRAILSRYVEKERCDALVNRPKRFATMRRIPRALWRRGKKLFLRMAARIRRVHQRENK